MVIWNLLKEDVSFLFVIHLAAVVLQSIAYDEIIDFESEIVSSDLVKHTLRNGYLWGFVFNNHTRS